MSLPEIKKSAYGHLGINQLSLSYNPNLTRKCDFFNLSKCLVDTDPHLMPT